MHSVVQEGKDVEKGRLTPVVTARAIETSSWMCNIDDNTLLSSLTIPGTHDSAAYDSPWPFVATQDLSILDQLRAGIRYFDLRMGLRNDILEMVHGPALLGRTLQSTLQILYDYLEEHPSEALLVQMNQHRSPEKSTIAFDTAVWDLLSREQYQKYWWIKDDGDFYIGALRKKIVLFRRFGRESGVIKPGEQGIDIEKWLFNPSRPFKIISGKHTELIIQDHYTSDVATSLKPFIEDKFANVVEMLNLAIIDEDSRRWYINYCSAYEINAYYRLSPWQVAVGGRDTYYRWVDGMNVRLKDWLITDKRYRGQKKRFGVVLLDFLDQPSTKLVSELIKTNFDHSHHKRHADCRRMVVGGVMTIVTTSMFVYKYCC